jgi:hypothetical protein
MPHTLNKNGEIKMTKLELINQKETAVDLLKSVPFIENIEFDVDYSGVNEFCRLTFTSGEKTYFKDLLTLATYISGMMRMQEELN